MEIQITVERSLEPDSVFYKFKVTTPEKAIEKTINLSRKIDTLVNLGVAVICIVIIGWLVFGGNQ